jgi:hypothetical protein
VGRSSLFSQRINSVGPPVQSIFKAAQRYLAQAGKSYLELSMFVRFGKLTCSKLFVLLSLLACASCSFGPSRVIQPGINPSSAGSAAIEAYDKNGDGNISGEELEHAPALKAALSRLDTNGDKGVSADEVAARVSAWQEMRTGMTSFAFTVTLDGTPVTDAIVTFEPDPILGDDIKAATSTTNQTGRGRASIPPEPGTKPSQVIPGMHIGLYRVKISKMVGGKETIPAKYNTDTVLGQEVADDVSEIAGNRVVYALSNQR